MIFKFAIVLFLSVLPSAVSEGASSTMLEQDTGEYPDKMEFGTTNFLRKSTDEEVYKRVRVREEDGRIDVMDVVDGSTTSDDSGAVSNYLPDLPTFTTTDSTAWNHGSYAVSARKSGTIEIFYPDDTEVGDTLFLFLSRTDDFLPVEISGWNRGAECFKSRNRAPQCLREGDCINRDGNFCRRFSRGSETGAGKDLATVMFYRHVTANDATCFTLEIGGTKTTWAVVTAITNVNRGDPIRSVDGKSCDRRPESLFPSVFGKTDDALLLSQCFDDKAELEQFLPPVGTDPLGFTNSNDEVRLVTFLCFLHRYVDHVPNNARAFLSLTGRVPLREKDPQNRRHRRTDYRRTWRSRLQGCVAVGGCE